MENSMNTLYKILAISTILLITNCINAISQDWLWAKQIGSSLDDGATGTCDGNGNLYIAGSYEGPVCYFPSTTLHANGISNIFLAKFDNEGNELWVKQFNVDNYSPGEEDGISDIILDANGNIYIAGGFYKILQFDTITLTASFGEDFFISKFKPDGSCIWARKAGGTGNDLGAALAVGSSFNVYVWGRNSEIAFFDSTSVDPGGFLVKYDSNGSFQWVKKEISFDGQLLLPHVFVTCMKIYQNRLFACGWENNPVFTIDTMTFSHSGKYGHILCCFDLDGNIQWAREGIGNGAYSGNNLSADIQGNTYITGFFHDTISFGGFILYHPLEFDMFLCKYDQNGSIQWARQANSSLSGAGHSIISNAQGFSYVTGQFSGSAVFGADTLFSATERDLFLARYTPEGECIGVRQFGNAEGWEVSLDAEENPYLVGDFRDSVTIGGTKFTAYGSWWSDIFITRGAPITGLKENRRSVSNRLVIYANPTEGKCNIILPDEFQHEKNLILHVYDSKGNLIQSLPVAMSGNKILLNLAAQASGIYHVTLTNGRKIYSGKIVFSGN
jgi:hypothetical protein